MGEAQSDIYIFAQFAPPAAVGEKMIAKIPAKNILTWYDREKKRTFSGRDNNDYDRGDGWTSEVSKNFLNKAYRKLDERFLTNDISNMNGGAFYQHSTHRDGAGIDFKINGEGDNFGDNKFSFNEFELIRNFVKAGAGSLGYERYIDIRSNSGRGTSDGGYQRGIIATQNLASGKSFVDYACINNKPASNYIRNGKGHFDHWHVDVTDQRLSSLRLKDGEEGQSSEIPYSVKMIQNKDGNKILSIRTPVQDDAVYSLLLIKPGDDYSPNDNAKFFTDESGSTKSKTIAIDANKSFTYTLDPKGGMMQIEVDNPEQGGLSLKELHDYKVRITKFVGSSNTYTKSNFVGASSCSFRDISLDFEKAVCGSCTQASDSDGMKNTPGQTCDINTPQIIFERVDKEVHGRDFSYFIEAGKSLDDDFFLYENNNSIASIDINEINESVRICGKSTVLSGKNIAIEGSLMLSNVVINGHDDGSIGIGNSSSRGIIQNVNITSEGGVVDIDGEVNVKGNQTHPLEFLTQPGAGLFVDGNASIDTSSSEEVSSISGNILIGGNATISGQITINADADINSPLGSTIANNAQIRGTNTMSGIFIITESTQVTNSTITGLTYQEYTGHYNIALLMYGSGQVSGSTLIGTPFVDGIVTNGATVVGRVPAPKLNGDYYVMHVHPSGIVNGGLADGILYVNGSIVSGGRAYLQSTCRYHSGVTGTLSTIIGGEGAHSVGDYTPDNEFVAAGSSAYNCPANSKVLSDIFSNINSDENDNKKYREAMRKQRRADLKWKILKKQVEARISKNKKMRKILPQEDHWDY